MSPRSAPTAAANRRRPTSASPSRPRPCGASSASAGGSQKMADNVADNVIEARGLLKLYGATRAVDAIDLDIRRGEIFGLLGPNGAGKTTTILMMLGLTETSGGSVDVLGFDPVRQPLEVKRRVGYLPDSVGTYSRGMKQRLGIAEIVMKRAEVAILDEPTSGLDPHATYELLEMIRSLKKAGVAVLLSSHLLDRVQSVCDRVALFNKGKIALMGTVVELANQVLGAGHPLLVEATGIDVAAALRGVEGVQQVLPAGEGAWRVIADRDVRATVAREIVSAGGSL